MAAGECVVQTTNGEEEPAEDDDDWSDFTSDSNVNSLPSCFEDLTVQKCFPSKDSSWVFRNVSETARLCFPVLSPKSQVSSCSLPEASSKEKLKEKPALLEENLHYSSYFPQPVWKGSNFESALISALDLLSANKEQEQESDVETIKREPGLFNFHHLAERSMDFWRGKWNLEVEETSANGLSRSRESLGNESSSDTKLNEFTGDLEIWTDSDGADSDEFFLLVGDQRPDETRSLEDSHAAAGLHQLPFEEVQELRNEMATYVKEYSDSLVEELMVKDEQLREKEIKNLFISSLLALQSKLRDIQSTQGKKKNGPSMNKYLTTVIPYMETPGGPDKQCLEKLVEIMDAMRSDSPTVPNLLTEYILKVLCPE